MPHMYSIHGSARTNAAACMPQMAAPTLITFVFVYEPPGDSSVGEDWAALANMQNNAAAQNRRTSRKRNVLLLTRNGERESGTCQ
jgi:hypothetical protein